MKKLKLGTIGTGFIVRNEIKAAQMLEDIELYVVYSRSEEKGKAMADEFGGAKVYTDLDEFFADPEMDVVYIASPNSLHYPQAKKALLAGKNVMLEKPFCTNLEDARDLVKTAEEKDLILINAIPSPYQPNMQHVLDNLPKVGNVRLVMANYSQYSSRIEEFLSGGSPNVFNTKFGGGCMSDITYYVVYFTTLLFGKPKDQRYFAKLHRGVDLNGVAMLDYGDFYASLAGAKDTRGVNYYQIEGDKGYIYVEHGANAVGKVTVVTKEGEESFDDNREVRAYYSVKEMSRIVREHDTKAMKEHMEVMLATVETMEKLQKDAGVVFDIER